MKCKQRKGKKEAWQQRGRQNLPTQNNPIRFPVRERRKQHCHYKWGQSQAREHSPLSMTFIFLRYKTLNKCEKKKTPSISATDHLTFYQLVSIDYYLYTHPHPHPHIHTSWYQYWLISVNNGYWLTLAFWVFIFLIIGYKFQQYIFHYWLSVITTL